MRTLVVLSHPVATSFSHACCEAAVRGLQSAGHDVTVLDLYAMGFQPAMSAAERRVYDSGDPILDPLVAESVAAVRAAEMLVFVYPTWWSGLPAIMKGWLERVMVPGVGFRFDERSGKVKPSLEHVRRIVGISTYGSPRPYVLAVNDNGRRILTRALRVSCGLRTRATWLGLYAIDTSSPEDRAEFAALVERTMADIR